MKMKNDTTRRELRTKEVMYKSGVNVLGETMEVIHIENVKSRPTNFAASLRVNLLVYIFCLHVKETCDILFRNLSETIIQFHLNSHEI